MISDNQIPTHILGVDPGLRGALCLYEVATHRIWLYDMPVSDGQVNPHLLASVIDAAKFAANVSASQIHAAIENVSSMPRQAGAFNFGRSAGVVHGVLGALNIPFSLIAPSQWKAVMGLNRSFHETQTQNKTRARDLAVKLWPGLAHEFKRVKDDGRAEAALIARYFRNKTTGTKAT
jgi:crossover junction endodeoxyribonuclease RuvC